MPSRHISPQSFDAILSELGDDPAIPDPHGIRKPSSPKHSSPVPPHQPKERIELKNFSSPEAFNQLRQLGGFAVFGLFLIAICIGLLMAYDSLKTGSEALNQESYKQLTELKKELALLRSEIEQDQDEFYEAIDLLEVSIHSLKENRSITRLISNPQALPHELELRRWRYLGTSRIGDSQQAFFHTGKSNVMFQKGGLVLGDWRLTQLEKDAATLTHAQGKTLNLKPSKTE
ncbi:hypothetical protein [Polynucleobacter hirudinilacicola]|nr:hypothetical protein [Polynucleobacter hirudinilacicola]